MSTQTHTLHRALLRPFLLHTLRAAGFHSTKPSVLDTLMNLTERYLILLASNTAAHAHSAHNDDVPTLSDVRSALQDCGALTPLLGAAEDEWKELLRIPVGALEGSESESANSNRNRITNGDINSNAEEDEEEERETKGIMARRTAEKRKRDEEDVGDVRAFTRWFEGPQYAEICRVAGRGHDGGDGAAVGAGAGGSGGGPAAGVGGGVVHVEDFLTGLKKRAAKGGGGVGGGGGAAAAEDARWVGTVLGRPADERSVLLEGGPVQRISDWRPPRQTSLVEGERQGQDDGRVDADEKMDDASSLSSGLSSPVVPLRDEMRSPSITVGKSGSATLTKDESDATA